MYFGITHQDIKKKMKQTILMILMKHMKLQELMK